jgi:carboxyl-terminal processing protease
MSENSQRFISAGAVVAVLGAIYAGLVIRDRQDLGTQPKNYGPLLVSRDKDLIDVPAKSYYEGLVEKLEREYVDPISDENKLAAGAVRGMVLSLNDPLCLYYDKDEFPALVKRVSGQYEGIGVDLALVFPPGAEPKAGVAKSREDMMNAQYKVPNVVVTNVAPGSPADKAGVKIGDIVQYVDERWVVNATELLSFRDLSLAVSKGKGSANDLSARRKDLKKKLDHSMMPAKVLDKLTLGTSGSIKVVWRRGKEPFATSLDKAATTVPTGAQPDGSFALRLAPEFLPDLEKFIAGKKEVTIDLRGVALGDFTVALKVIQLLGGGGDYGALKINRDAKAKSITFPGEPKSLKLTFLVNGATRGSAETLVNILAAKRGAKVLGQASGHPDAIDIVALPTGTGYSLYRGSYPLAGVQTRRETEERGS